MITKVSKSLSFSRAALLIAKTAMAVAVAPAFGQVPATLTSPGDQPGLIEQLEARPDDLSVIMRIMANPQERAVPALQRAFESVATEPQKQWLAVALVRSGADSAEPLDYLIEEARKTIDSAAPSPIAFDEFGGLDRENLNPAFLEWCLERGLDPNREASNQIYTIPRALQFLEYTGSPEVRPVLIAALSTDNSFLVIHAARALLAIAGSGAVSAVSARADASPRDQRCALVVLLMGAAPAEESGSLFGRYPECELPTLAQ
ncbi:MAG: hypothetical protein O2795_05745 [Acidobacteria bacterium]|nr:hypothetical protein [Acidobacteriota bacterium]